MKEERVNQQTFVFRDFTCVTEQVVGTGLWAARVGCFETWQDVDWIEIGDDFPTVFNASLDCRVAVDNWYRQHPVEESATQKSADTVRRSVKW